MSAKYYVYWNLHRKLWSVRHRGKVIDHCRQLYVEAPEFKVSEAGRQRVLAEKKKNVHAYVVSESRPLPVAVIPHRVREGLEVISYNPYKGPDFTWKSDGSRAEGLDALALTHNGKVLAERT